MARVDQEIRSPGGAARTTALLLGSLTLLAAGTVLWLVVTAVENERLANRQRWREAGEQRLALAVLRMREAWSRRLAAAGQLSALPPPEAFAAIVRDGLADSALCQGRSGAASDYPAPPGPLSPPPEEEVRGERDPEGAEAPPAELASVDPALGDRLRAGAGAADWLEGQRRLIAAGRTDAALEISQGYFARRRDGMLPGGRLAAPASDLMLLRVLKKSARALPEWLTARLRGELATYKNSPLPSAQRRFLMEEAADLIGESPAVLFPLFPGERLAQAHLSNTEKAVAVPAGGSGVTLLFQPETPARILEAAGGDPVLRVLPPGAPAGAGEVTSEIHPSLPDWTAVLNVGASSSSAWGNRLFLLTLAGSGVTLLLGALTFLTWRHVRRRVRRAQLREEMAATVSHELRTPLASMRLLVESLLEEEHPDAEKTRDYLRLIARENARLSGLISNFLTLARLERRAAEPTGVVSAVEVLEAVLQAAAAAGHGDRLKLLGETPQAEVRADAADVETALLNLIDNACKYSPAGSPVELSVTAGAGRVRFSVRDHGPGLTREQAARVWEPFERLAPSVGSGCGLGLAIVRRIADRAGGKVEISSPSGGGCEFSIALPMLPSKT